MKTHVVIPVLKEPETVGFVIKELAKIPGDIVVDFIDDSPNDATQVAIRREASRFPDLEVRSLHRKREETADGLAGSVVAGMQRAIEHGADVVTVMDGDGQHPASTIPHMLERLSDTGSDLVVASRYIRGGSSEGLDGGFRHFVSFASTKVAKGLFPNRLRDVTDPMTGFFAVRLNSIRPEEIHATGFKILLELVLRNDGLLIREVPVKFEARKGGQTKAKAKQGKEYLQQLLRLRFTTTAISTAGNKKLSEVQMS